MKRRKPARVLVLLAAFIPLALAQAPDTVRVVSRTVERKSRLPGEFLPYERVDLNARVTGFVESVGVDRGSFVKAGEVLAELSAPEMTAQIAEAKSKAQAAQSQRAEAEARLVAAQSTWEKLKIAAATPGVVAGNDLVLAEKQVDAARAALSASEDSAKAAQAAIDTLEDLQSYLKLTAPFDGVITERLVHPGALVGPNTGGPLLRLEQNARLRLVVAVPEQDVGGIIKGGRIPFTVPAYPGQTFQGSIARIAHSMDQKTRTMAVELDVANLNLALAPGMYAEVNWPMRRGRPTLLVPPSSIVTTTERTFVIRVSDGKAEWVDVRRGLPFGDLVEAFGALTEGDQILRRASDEVRPGTPISR